MGPSISTTSPSLAGGAHGRLVVGDDWLAATALRPLLLGDPASLWLEYHGAAHGFEPSRSSYDFLDYVAAKSAQFEAAWAQRLAPGAPQVCQSTLEVHDGRKVQETLRLMQAGEPVILQPALWWAPERLYGVPDALAQVGWLRDTFPSLAAFLARDQVGDQAAATYAALDLKFFAHGSQKKAERDVSEVQLQIYSYMLGHMQQHMPTWAFLVTRDRALDPLAVRVHAALGQPLDAKLARLRDTFVEIKRNGALYTPWADPIVASDLAYADDAWRAAKKRIAHERYPGRQPDLLPWICAAQKKDLAALGFASLDALLALDPDQIPLEQCSGLSGPARQRIRAVLAANRTGQPITPPLAPRRRKHEFFVDLEYLTNLNVDFDAQWPALLGREMIFMVGVGWEEDNAWRFRVFIAEAETHQAEMVMLQQFLAFLDQETGGAYQDAGAAALYHWSPAEQWQARKTADRQGLPADHPLRRLPWVDLAADVALAAPIAVPGAWDYKLKTVARALGKLDPAFDPHWPGDLDQGKRAMVMGWKAYEAPAPLAAPEMPLLIEYLEADCRAVWSVLRWMRATATEGCIARNSCVEGLSATGLSEAR